MIPSSNILIPASIGNPDSASIETKSLIDISLTISDVSASNNQDKIMLNYELTEITVIDDNLSETKGDIYFTPLYTEKIDYEVWKTTINKSFQELEAL
jgi:hypothetical protein